MEHLLRAFHCPGTAGINNLYKKSEEWNLYEKWANVVLMLKGEGVIGSKNYTSKSVMSIPT